MSLAELVTPKFIALQTVKYVNSAKSPNVLKESCNLLTNMIEEFGALSMPLKEMIEFAKLCINHPNQ